VSDFGLAKWLDATSDLTRTLTTFGTPGYIAPEQADGGAGNLTPAADVYSLGAILFDLLSGRPPFIGSHALSVIRQAFEKPAPKLRSLSKLADRDLETVCAKCLEREPRARYHSAADLAEDLERWLAGRPIKARPVLPPIKLWRLLRRNPQVIVTAGTCLALSTLAIWFTRQPVGTPPSPDKSVAVLPFENLNRDQENAFFADGVQDDVLTDLAKIQDLKVINASSVRSYKAGTLRNLSEIARMLGVQNIVEGTARRAGNRVRLSARLVDPITGKQRWAETYDRELTEVFALQSEIAQAIASQLHAQLSPAEETAIAQRPTSDVKAYELYAKAKDLLRTWKASNDQRKAVGTAVELLEEATRRDPTFALAYSQLVIAHTIRHYGLGDGADAETAAKQAMDTALRLAPELGATHLAIARYYATFPRDYDAARRELTIALRTLPNDADALLYTALADRRLGHWDDAVAELRKAAVLNPKDITTINVVRDTYLMLRRYREAEEYVKQEMIRAPEFSGAYLPLLLVDCYVSEGNLEAAKNCLATVTDKDSKEEQTRHRYVVGLRSRDVAAARRAMSAYPNGFSCFSFTVFLPFRFFEGEMALAEHDITGAKACFAEALSHLVKEWGANPVDPWQIALLARTEAILGDKNNACRHALRAAALRPVEKDPIDGTPLKTNLAS